MSGNIKKYKRNKGFEPIRREMLQDEDNLSIDAIGLLCNLTSYPDTWTLHKTELYRRFAKTGRRRIENAWNELVEERYIVQLRRRNGKRWEYIYYHSDMRFTSEDISKIEESENCSVWDGKMSSKKKEESNQGKVMKKRNVSMDKSNVTVVQSNMNSDECTGNKETSKEINYQDKINTLDTVIDTHSESYQQVGSLFNNAFVNNSAKIPSKLAHCLYLLGRGEKYAGKLYKTILRAKKDAGRMIERTINFEDQNGNIHIEEAVIDIVSRVMRKFRSGQVKSLDGYLYKSIRDELVGKLKPSYFPDGMISNCDYMLKL